VKISSTAEQPDGVCHEAPASGEIKQSTSPSSSISAAMTAKCVAHLRGPRAALAVVRVPGARLDLAVLELQVQNDCAANYFALNNQSTNS